MNTKEVGVYKVTIGGDEYTKSVMEIRGFKCVDYRVVRNAATGKKTPARLNPDIHRAAICRVEAALAEA